MRLLILEVDADFRALLKASFEAECYAVDVIDDAERASYLARTNEYDLVILSESEAAPIHACDICAEIRRHGKTMPIVVLTTRCDVSFKVDLFNVGADECLIKPVSFEELLARTRALLRRPKQLEPEVYTVDDLVLDSRGHVATRGGTSIRLTRKELMLLCYLMQHKGAVVTRGMLIEHVWDMHLDPLSNTIDTHILSLRKKLNVGSKHKLIHTIPGRGYKLDFVSTEG